MRIQVTKEHIERGVRLVCDCCPVALALREKMDGYMVSVKTSRFYSYRDDWYYKLPQIAQDFIRRFDAGEPVEPFEFEVEL